MANREQVEHVIRVFENEHKTPVSFHAREIISTVISAIVEDPHRAWKAERSELSNFSNDLLRQLPEYLSEIANSERFYNAPRFERPYPITTFDVMHWFAKRLDAICPIPK